MSTGNDSLDNFLIFCLLCFFSPLFLGIAVLLIDGREGRQRANLEQKIQERILEQKRGSNKKQINNADRRAAIQRKWKEIGKKNS